MQDKFASSRSERIDPTAHRQGIALVAADGMTNERVTIVLAASAGLVQAITETRRES